MRNINQISSSWSDLKNLDSAILRDFTKKLNIDKLDAVKDSDCDSLVSILFKMKIENIVKDGHYLHKCLNCHQLFTKS